MGELPSPRSTFWLSLLLGDTTSMLFTYASDDLLLSVGAPSSEVLALNPATALPTVNEQQLCRLGDLFRG